MILKLRALKFVVLCLTFCAVSACQAQTTQTETQSISQGALLSVACANCHSRSGQGSPNISDLSEARMQKYLMYYKSDIAGTSVMHRLSRGLSDEDIRLISAYYAQKND